MIFIKGATILAGENLGRRTKIQTKREDNAPVNSELEL